MVKSSLKEKAHKTPQTCGVYLWKDGGGRILYVGKALNLRKRLSDYFTSRIDPKTALMLKRAANLEWILTGNEAEALLLEDALVKNHQPRYNVRLRDDKRYPYLKITLAEKYPRLILTRRIEEDGARYFGPYTDVGAVRRTMKLLSRLFGVRVCGKNPDKSSACLNYHMGRCIAPCEYASKVEYDLAVSQALDFLQNAPKKTISSLKKQMRDYSKKLMFEKAQKLKFAIADVEAMNISQKVAFPNLEESDFIGYAAQGGRANITLLKVRRGFVVATLHYPLTGGMRFDARASTKVFVKQYYATKDVLPKNIYVSHHPTDLNTLKEILSQIKGRKVRIIKPLRGRKRKLVAMAQENSLHEIKNKSLSSKKPKPNIILKKLLDLPETPHRIEGYDISNLSGEDAVGSMVVFSDDQPDKKQYRRFRIKTLEKPNDPAMLFEVLDRRLGNDWPKPCLILVDGGKTQLNAVQKALVKHQQKIPSVALAKEKEQLYLPGRKTPLSPSKSNEGLKLLMYVRDEAHRFAVAYHKILRRRRSRNNTSTL